MQVNAGTFTLCPETFSTGVPAHATTQILVDSNSFGTGQYLAALLFRSTGYQFQIVTNNGSNAVKGVILLTTQKGKTSLGAEGYELTVAPDYVVSRAPAEAGVFYGAQSLVQLLPPQILSLQPVTNVPWIAPCVYIQDQPRFSWRGYMMDESRHFFGKNEVKKFMDAMALQKMNTFHWHLVDDEGWRIEILEYPLLTQVSGWRNGWNSAQNNGIDFGQNPRVSSATNGIGQYGGFYTQNDIREIVAYAQQRHITIVPEIEMPAHCTSGLYAYPQFGCGWPQSTYVMDVTSSQNVPYRKCLLSLGTDTNSPNSGVPFLQNVLTEVASLFPGPYIHCGGDEVIATGDHDWTNYPIDSNQIVALGILATNTNIVEIKTAYQHWFSTNMSAFLQSQGKTMMGWSEFEAGGIVPNAILEDWETGTNSFAVQAATSGEKVVMAPDVYTYLNYYMNATNWAQGTYYPVGEPYFNSSNSVLTLSNVYNYEPVPTNLPAQYVSNILGTECAEWAEYIPSTRNEEFKAFPRLCAMAEVQWTQAALKNYTNFTQRLATHEQRLAAMGMNYNGTNTIAIGTWGPTVSTSTNTFTYDITSYVKSAGDINLDFHYTGGPNALNIYSTALLVNGVTVDADNTGYAGYAGPKPGYSPAIGNLPYFVLHLKTFVPGATYQVQATCAGYTGTSCSGTIYMVNWN